MSLEDFKTEDLQDSDQQSEQSKSNRSRGDESKEHFNKKIEIAENLENKGWDVEVEKKVRTGNIADVYATRHGKELIIEVGSIEQERLDLLKSEFDEVRNVGYEYFGELIKGAKNRSEATTKTISLSDDAFMRMYRNKPENVSFSSFIEELALGGLEMREAGQTYN